MSVTTTKANRSGNPIAPFAGDDLSRRFWRDVDVSAGMDACWPWTGLRERAGYGRIYLGRRDGRELWTKAGRVALFLTGVDLGPDEYACHTCDNPPCCNPAHLFAGTNSANILDAVAKGRAAHQTHPERIARGERNGLSKLTAVQVLAIREAYVPYRVSYPVLARQFGVSKQTIRNVITGQGWAWLASPA